MLESKFMVLRFMKDASILREGFFSEKAAYEAFDKATRDPNVIYAELVEFADSDDIILMTFDSNEKK